MRGCDVENGMHRILESRYLNCLGVISSGDSRLYRQVFLHRLTLLDPPAMLGRERTQAYAFRLFAHHPPPASTFGISLRALYPREKHDVELLRGLTKSTECDKRLRV